MVSSLTTLDFLYLSLTVGIIILVVVLTVATIQAILVLRDVRKISSVAGDITEKFHELIIVPVSTVTRVSHAVAPHVENFVADKLDKLVKKKKKTSSKKKKSKKTSS